jgi:hypothetical protein
MGKVVGGLVAKLTTIGFELAECLQVNGDFRN